MTWNISGNHLVTIKDEDRGGCDCGGDWEEIDWCDETSCECAKDNCDNYTPNFDCPNRKTRLRCQDCETTTQE